MQRPKSSPKVRDKILAAFQESGMTQGEFAGAAGVAQSRLNNILQGENVTTRLAIPIVRYIQKRYPGASMDWLFDDRMDWPPPDAAVSARPVLSEAEQDLLTIVRNLGPELARRRLLLIPDQDSATGPGYAPAPPPPPAAPPSEIPEEKQRPRRQKSSDDKNP